MNIDYTAQHMPTGTIITGIVMIQTISEHVEEFHISVFGPSESPSSFCLLKEIDSDWRPQYESQAKQDFAVIRNDDYEVKIEMQRLPVGTSWLNKKAITCGMVISYIRSEHEDKFQINAFGQSEERYTCDKQGTMDGLWRFDMGIFTLGIEVSRRNHQHEERLRQILWSPSRRELEQEELCK